MGSILGVFQGNHVCDSALDIAQSCALFQGLLEPGLVIWIGVVVEMVGQNASLRVLAKASQICLLRCLEAEKN